MFLYLFIIHYGILRCRIRYFDYLIIFWFWTVFLISFSALLIKQSLGIRLSFLAPMQRHSIHCTRQPTDRQSLGRLHGIAVCIGNLLKTSVSVLVIVSCLINIIASAASTVKSLAERFVSILSRTSWISLKYTLSQYTVNVWPVRTRSSQIERKQAAIPLYRVKSLTGEYRISVLNPNFIRK